MKWNEIEYKWDSSIVYEYDNTIKLNHPSTTMYENTNEMNVKMIWNWIESNMKRYEYEYDNTIWK